jgi:outer membrane protein assembly factor BamD
MKIMIKIKNIVLMFTTLFFLVACSSKIDAEYNKPALYWYNKMLTQLSEYDIDGADDTYSSLESEHRNSPLISEALLILANAHIEDEAYSLANFYLDEYIKRFALSENVDYAKYLKIKANFMAIQFQDRDQTLIEDTTKQIKVFKIRNKGSVYMPLVDSINTRLYMAKALLDKKIADLYTKLDKPKAAEFYKSKVDESWIEVDEIEPVSVPFYRYIFE